jgi:hypothetical protein
MKDETEVIPHLRRCLNKNSPGKKRTIPITSRQGLVTSTTRPWIPDAVETGEATAFAPANHAERAVRLQYDRLGIHEAGEPSAPGRWTR